MTAAHAWFPVALLALVPTDASADGLADIGEELAPSAHASPGEGPDLALSGAFRFRGEALTNLDLDRGLTPSGQPIFPVPVADPTGQTLTGGDTRLRTDLAFMSAGRGVAVKLRVDVLDNLAFGSTPIGKPASGRAPSPSASPGQAPPAESLVVKRAYGEAVLPFGVLAVGRQGSHFGLGMVAHSGDCDDCDSGDAADRVAFATPLIGHIFAAAFDLTSTGPVRRRRDTARAVDIEPTDNVKTFTLAAFRLESDLARRRYREAGRTVFEYGALLSYRWQQNDVPADYLPVAQPMPLSPGQIVQRGYRAAAADAWIRLSTRALRVEAEAAYLYAEVDEPSLVPGVLFGRPVTSRQLGLAIESEYALGSGALGFDFGYASGDDAPGFGAFPDPTSPAPSPGDLDGAQADLPRDTTVDNFRFHPDYRVDRILFREIIGTVTDAIYLRPTARYTLLTLGPSQLSVEGAAIASFAAEASSTPSGSRFLGFEIDPSLVYRSGDGFRAALDYALLLPGSAFDNPATGQGASTAQSVRFRVGYHF